MAPTEAFERERARLTRLASGLLRDPHEAQDIVQLAWLRLERTPTEIDDLPAWLTTVTTRLCLDRLKARVAVPADPVEGVGTSPAPGPASVVEESEAVGAALGVVLDRLEPRERVAFVLHDSFGFDFATIAALVDRTPTAARQLASRARAKVAGAPRPGESGAPGSPTDWQVVDAFMAAARGGDLARLVELLAPGARVRADAAAVASGTPARIDGRQAVAEFFDGSATAALPVFLDGRPGAAWYHRGTAMVAFDFTVVDGAVESIVFRAEPQALARVARREAGAPRAR